MLNCRRLSTIVLACVCALLPVSAFAASVSLPLTEAPVTFVTVNVGSTISGCTGCTDTETVNVTLNQTMTISSITIPASANGHAEWSVGTVTGCFTDGTTQTAALAVCSIPVTFKPFYPGFHAVPLSFTLSNGQIYSVPLTATGVGGLQHIEPNSTATVVGGAGTTASSTSTDNVSATAVTTTTPIDSIVNLYSPNGVYIDNQENYFLTQGLAANPRIRVVYNQADPALACLIITEQPGFFGNPTNGCAGATSQPTIGDIYTLAGTGTSGAGGENVLATSSALNTVTDVSADATYDIFLVDQGNSRVRVVYNGGAQVACLIEIENPATFGVTGNDCTTSTSLPTVGDIYTIAGTGTAGTSDTGGRGTSTAVSLPTALTLGQAGDVYFTTSSTASTAAHAVGRVKILYSGGAAAAALISATNATVTTPVKGFLYTVAGTTNSTTTDGGDGTLATSTGVGILTSNGIAVDAAGDIYFTDVTSGSGTPLPTAKVRAIYNGGANLSNLLNIEYPSGTPAVGFVYEIAGTTSGASKTYSAGEGMIANAAQQIAPYGLGLDAAGDLLITERYGYTIQRLLISNGKINTILGLIGGDNQTTTIGASYTNIVGTTATATSVPGTDGPVAVKNGNSGTFYNAEPVGNRLHKASVQTATISFATTPTGTTGTAVPLLYTNVGNAPTTISAITMPADFVMEASTVTNGSIAGMNACAVNTPIPAGSSCSIAVAPQPSTSGTLSETMTVTDNALGGEITSHNITLGVSASGTAIALSTNPVAITGGNPTVINAILTSTTGPVNTGNVVFTSGMTSIGTSPISDTVVSGVAVTASGSGYTSAPAVTITCTSPGCTGGSGATATATIVGDGVASINVTNFGTGYTGAAPTVTLTGGGGTGAIATAAVGGLATITSSIFAAPSTSITASYATQGTFTAGVVTKVFTVSAKPATVTMTSASPLSPNLHQTVTLAATVTSAITGTPTGTVNFYDGAPPPGTGTFLGSGSLSVVNGNDVASTTISTLAVGPHTIQANYLGDSVYASSVDATGQVVTVIAPAFTVTLTTNPGVAVPAGAAAVVGVSVATVGGYTGTVPVSCGTALPAHIGCVYSPSSYVFTGANNTLTGTITIVTNFPATTANLRRSNTTVLAFLLPGAALAFFGLRRRSLRKWQRSVLMLICGLIVTAGLCACGNSKGSDAAYGTYSVPITFSDGTTTQTIYVTVTVTG